jgi:hypothetical protein
MSLLLRYTLSFPLLSDFPHPHFDLTGLFSWSVGSASRVMTLIYSPHETTAIRIRAKSMDFFFLHIVFILDCENRNIEYGMHQRGALI